MLQQLALWHGTGAPVHGGAHQACVCLLHTRAPPPQELIALYMLLSSVLFQRSRSDLQVVYHVIRFSPRKMTGRQEIYEVFYTTERTTFIDPVFVFCRFNECDISGSLLFLSCLILAECKGEANHHYESLLCL